MGLSSYDSAIKIGQAIAELRAEGPLLLDPHLNAVVRFVELGGTDRSWATSAPDLDRLMKPIIEIVRPDLEATD